LPHTDLVFALDPVSETSDRIDRSGSIQTIPTIFQTGTCIALVSVTFLVSRNKTGEFMSANLIKHTIITGLLLAAYQSQALPLLSESAALNSGSALTLYPDHQDPTKFYFMPNSSKIGRDSKNVPTFSLTYYGLDDPKATDSGGFMVYVGRLTSDTDQSAAIDNFLKSHPGAGVAVLPIVESTIDLTSTAGSAALSPLYSEFNFSQKGGRAEDEIGINAMLTRIGAKVMKASLLKEAGASMKWDMCYKVQGLGPAMDGEITVNMNRVYDHFAATASAGGFWWRASINVEIEKLVKSKDVSWVINGGDAKDEDYIREATQTIVERMFKPELTMSPSGNKTVWDNITPFSFGASYTHREEHDTEHWVIKRRTLETREFCVPLTLKDIQDNKDKCVIDAD